MIDMAEWVAFIIANRELMARFGGHSDLFLQGGEVSNGTCRRWSNCQGLGGQVA
jgi:hypothetical protein